MTSVFFPCTIGVRQSVGYLNLNPTFGQRSNKVSELN